ncbi:MAG: M48 family metallopeptidase [Bacteroidales bacterium]|nr:M48 family metallopeptidase [Bacteroidales bacterium]
MKNVKWILMVVLTAMMASCGTATQVPLTGRKQRLVVSDEEVMSLSNQEYEKYMKTAKSSADATKTAMVKRVGQRLATAVETYLQTNGLANEVSNFKWEFNLVQNNQVNAFCMPGGKIVVYEGILPVTQDEASLAIVLGHEIAHAVAKHSAERISNSYKQQTALQVLGGVAQVGGMGPNTQSIVSSVIGVGTQAWTSGFSRRQESEADRIGLIFAAMAGYDPQIAVAFWQRMAAQGTGSSSIFSDHPSDAKRIQQIQGWIPEAQKYYKPVAVPIQTATKQTTTTRKTSTKKK